MMKNRRSPLVYYPKTVNELLTLYKSMPDSMVYAGGTGIMSSRVEKYPNLNRNILFLSRIEELAAIRRSEGYLEIGACAKLNRILGIGEHVLKPALYRALQSIGTNEIRNLATIGGNLCSSYRIKSLHPLFILLDVRLELKKHGGSRWVTMRKFDNPETGLQPGEILTRIRIPFNNYNFQKFMISGNLKCDFPGVLTFCSLANIQKEVLTEIKFSAGYENDGIFRAREFEDALSGRKLPIFGIPEEPVFNRLATALKNQSPPLSLFHQQQIEGLLLSFIHYLNDLI